jgi:hypothetical protein
MTPKQEIQQIENQTKTIAEIKREVLKMGSTCFCGSAVYCENLCLYCYRAAYPDERFYEPEMSQRDEDILDNPRD